MHYPNAIIKSHFPREMLWGGRWEGGSRLGTHVRIKDFKIKKIKNKKKGNGGKELQKIKNKKKIKSRFLL